MKYHRGGDGRMLAVNHHLVRVANQDAVNAGAIHQTRAREVVGRHLRNYQYAFSGIMNKEQDNEPW